MKLRVAYLPYKQNMLYNARLTPISGQIDQISIWAGKVYGNWYYLRGELNDHLRR